MSSASPSKCQGSVATPISGQSRKSASMLCCSRLAASPEKFSRPSRTRVSISSGQWASPLASPWVSDESQKPPLRELAPEPAVLSFEHRHPQAGLVFQGQKRGPKTGEPAADHRQIGLGLSPPAAGSRLERRRDPTRNTAGRAATSAWGAQL